jgi:hypothetical protein
MRALSGTESRLADLQACRLWIENQKLGWMTVFSHPSTMNRILRGDEGEEVA